MAFFRRTSRGPLALAMALSLLLGFGLARGLLATDDLRSQLDLFSQVLYLVQNNYVDVPDNQKLIKGAIDGMLKTLDPHTVYLPEKRAEQMDEQFHGEYSGIGIQFDIRDGAIVVISPLEGTPSYRLGIRAGDRITSIDGKPLDPNLTTDDVFKLLRGPSGSIVQVTIEREDEPAPLSFSIERAKIPIESIPYAYMIRPGVGYVRIIRFSQTTGEELEKSLATLKSQGMKSLMLDLRSNSGGLLSQAVDVVDQLVPGNKRVVYTRGRINSANADYFTNDRAKAVEGPIVVLIDHGSASASEIVSGAIQDLDRGLVVGHQLVRQGPGPEPAPALGRLEAAAHDRQVLHAERTADPARLHEVQRSRATTRATPFKDVPSDSVLATRPSSRPRRPHGVRRRRHLSRRRAQGARQPDAPAESR
jgi:carboxyl-terminal processing protease